MQAPLTDIPNHRTGADFMPLFKARVSSESAVLCALATRCDAR